VSHFLVVTKPDYAGVLLTVAAGLVGIAWAAFAWTVQERPGYDSAKMAEGLRNAKWLPASA
jgi:hypothetical protein